MLTHDRLLSLLSYDPETGIFIWLQRPTKNSRRMAGSLAGGIMSLGRWRLKVEGKFYYAHRLAWFYMTAEWPSQIDHVDRDPLNNRWSNLRLANDAQQIWNRRFKNGANGGYIGVRKSRRKWAATIRGENGTSQYLGNFSTPEEAARAYDEKALQLRGEFAVINFPVGPP